LLECGCDVFSNFFTLLDCMFLHVLSIGPFHRLRGSIEEGALQSDHDLYLIAFFRGGPSSLQCRVMAAPLPGLTRCRSSCTTPDILNH
jgi:hypothetical protein